MASPRHEEIIALGREPVSAASPVGEPVRYEEAFEKLQAQMDRMTSLAGLEPEWGEVVSLATEILRNKSKDLLVMTYLCVGLFEKEGYEGLAAGLVAYRELLKAYWEACFPKVKPPHGRYNAVQYLADRIMPQVELKGGVAKRQPAAREKEAVHLCADAVAEFDQAVATAFASQPEVPNLMPLVRALKALKEKVGPLLSDAPAAPAGAPAGGGEEGGGGAPASAPAGGGGAPGGVIPDSFNTATQAVQAVVKVAKYLFTQDNKDARAYRLMRAVHFGSLTEPPKDRLLPGPPAPRRQFFENLATSGNWPQLLTDSEGQFASTPLWLDMQRYVCTALNGLGPLYAAAHDAVMLESAALATRLPALFEVSFKDGTGLADGATRAWLNEARGRFGSGGGGGDGAAAGNDPVGAAVGAARKLLAEAKQAEAVNKINDLIEASAGRRQRFRGQLALAGLMLDLNKFSLATPILEGLETVIDQYHLEDWEPELAAEATRSLFECLLKSKPKPTPEESQRLAVVFARLCRLNPAAALKLEAKIAKA